MANCLPCASASSSSSEMIGKVLGAVCGTNHKEERAIAIQNGEIGRIKGTVVLMKKNFLDSEDVGASFLDKLYELFNRGVSFQLVSANRFDPEDESRGKVGKSAHLEKWLSKFTSVSAGDVTFDISFEWDESMGTPGAFIVKNYHHSQFYLKTVTLHGVPGEDDGELHFICNSWVYPAHRYKYNRVFFSNKPYLPSDTPEPLRLYREEELVNLRGNGEGTLKEWDRVYDYAYYNDLGSPDKGPEHVRPVLGGTQQLPYPRRGRTSRRPTRKDSKTESRLPLLNLNIYVPRDERFSLVKFSDFLAYAVKSLGQVLLPEFVSLFDKPINEFDSFEDVYKIYDKGFEFPDNLVAKKLKNCVSWELFRELIRSDGERPLKFPFPSVISVDRSAWRTDEEFGREMLAGVNPVAIRRLQEFPPISRLDRREYGDHNSTIKWEDIEENMNGLSIKEALEENRLYILDHHDSLMPYLARINTTKTQTYATRTVLLLQHDCTLKPLAIELSLPHPQGPKHGATSKVFTPAKHGVEGSVWQLAKAYVAVNDTGCHQLLSHWLNTHAVIEPFIISANRQLSVLHPIFKLLQPHFRDTMNINALARHTLINSGGVLEVTVFPGKYALELSSFTYKSWVFPEQALPADLLKRGMAVSDPSKPNGIRLLIEDYPYAVDGLEIWSAIEEWVTEYCNCYYHADEMVRADSELQSWWKELREVGHGDLKDKGWWPKMQGKDDLIQTCTIIIWIASALHAAINFGQYPYGGFLPNRPSVSRRLMPEPGSPAYAELESNPDLAYLKTITAQFQTLLGVSLIEVLSRHASDEIYLGQRENEEWTSDDEPREAFERFHNKLVEIEQNIMERNVDKRLKNRSGPVEVPYTLLIPDSNNYSKTGGLTGKGIPNSVSI